MSDDQLEDGVAAALKAAAQSGSETGTGLAHTTGSEPEQASLFAVEGDLDALALPPRKGGRPKGAMNLKTRDLMRMMELRGFRDPLLFLADVYSRPVEDLAKDLGGMSKPDAFALQIKAAEAVAPYVHAKRTPTAPLVPKAPTVVMIHAGGGGNGPQQAGGEVIDGQVLSLGICIPQDEENQ